MNTSGTQVLVSNTILQKRRNQGSWKNGWFSDEEKTYKMTQVQLVVSGSMKILREKKALIDGRIVKWTHRPLREKLEYLSH
jgi:hypothetical protein